MTSDYMGKKLRVKIVEAGKHYMKCELLDNTPASRPEGVPEPMKKGQVSGAPTNTDSPQAINSSYHPLLIVSLLVLVVSLFLKFYNHLSSD